jgi:hypothetical protein
MYSVTETYLNFMQLSLVQLSRQSIAAVKFKIQQARDRWFKPQMLFILAAQLVLIVPRWGLYIWV